MRKIIQKILYCILIHLLGTIIVVQCAFFGKIDWIAFVGLLTSAAGLILEFYEDSNHSRRSKG